MMPPYWAHLCFPKTTVEQDATKGKWVRVGKNINAQSGLWTLVRAFRIAVPALRN